MLKSWDHPLLRANLKLEKIPYGRGRFQGFHCAFCNDHYIQLVPSIFNLLPLVLNEGMKFTGKDLHDEEGKCHAENP